MTEIPKNSMFEFSMPEFVPVAAVLLKLDPALAKMRYDIVPKL